MIEIDGDLKVVARVKKAGQTYELKEVSIDDLQTISKLEDQTESLYMILEKGGIPRDVAKTFPVSALKQLEKAIVGEMSEKK